MDKFELLLQVEPTIAQLTSNFSLSQAVPNNSLVKEVLAIDASTIDDVSNSKLSQYLIVLGQYLVMLRYNQNLINIKHMLSQKTFEHNLKIAMFKAEAGPKTVKEKRAKAIIDSDDLIEQEKTLIFAEAEKLLLEGMFDAVSELLNALKKEKSSRDTESHGR